MIYSGKLITDYDADKCLLQITILWLDISNVLFTIDKFKDIITIYITIMLRIMEKENCSKINTA